MLASFFPRPKQFFLLALIWAVASVLFWNTSISDMLNALFGVEQLDTGLKSLSTFASILFFLVFAAILVLIFALFWAADRDTMKRSPQLVAATAIISAAGGILMWNFSFPELLTSFGLDIQPPPQPIIGMQYFISPDFIAFYAFYLIACMTFDLFWRLYAPHPWQTWSIIGSSLILLSTYLGVQIAVAINNWRRPFFDLVQEALEGNGPLPAWELYAYLFTFAYIAFFAVGLITLTRFFISHFIFRWRTAMNDYYLQNWKKLRHVEGASQRIQEDTMRFATIMENLGVNVVEAVMTLFAFLPILLALSAYITELPIIGKVAQPLFWSALFWSMFGTFLLAFVGIKLPGLEFRNQRVEAAFRKELVYGEDHHDRAKPETMTELFANVRRNYFRLYFHYMYFNVARNMYFQADNIFGFFILIPTIAAGAITLGLMQQVLTAFSQVSNSFQLVVASWPTVVELLSIFKRLQTFEAVLEDEPLPAIDREYLERKGARNQSP